MGAICKHLYLLSIEKIRKKRISKAYQKKWCKNFKNGMGETNQGINEQDEPVNTKENNSLAAATTAVRGRLVMRSQSSATVVVNS